MKKIAVYGATGSVGSQALDVVRRFPTELCVQLLSCNTRIDLLARGANEFRPAVLVVTSPEASVAELRRMLAYSPQIFHGADALVSSLDACAIDLAVNAVAGISGLPLLAAALSAGIPTALSNKESVVAGADVIARLRSRTKTPVYPVDSEHAAIYQCLGNTFRAENASVIWLTASGGPFLHTDPAAMASASVESALRHPNWKMGPKITIDSATMANKGLEVIEACFLFDVTPAQVKVVVQPRSLVHSMVEFRDTTVLAQMGLPDMRVPLERALFEENAGHAAVGRPLDFLTAGSIEFLPPDLQKFRCLALAYEALRLQRTAVYNAADDAAVKRFLSGEIRLGAIAGLIEEALLYFDGAPPADIAEILELDAQVREYVMMKTP